MATDPKKRQKKLQRRAAKRKEKKHTLARAHSAGLPERLSAAARCPVLYCWVPDNLGENGIGWVVLSRALPSGSVAVASFLVDSYCLGVKNVFAEVLHRSDFDSKYLRKKKEMNLRSAPPAEARKLLEEAVAYARSLGFSPHSDYPRALILFGNVDPASSDAQFEFGKDGKPFFVAGPNDTLERSRQILAILTKTVGPGNFDSLIPLSGSEMILADQDGLVEEEEEELDEPDDFGRDDG